MSEAGANSETKRRRGPDSPLSLGTGVAFPESPSVFSNCRCQVPPPTDPETGRSAERPGSRQPPCELPAASDLGLLEKAMLPTPNRTGWAEEVPGVGKGLWKVQEVVYKCHRLPTFCAQE